MQAFSLLVAALVLSATQVAAQEPDVHVKFSGHLMVNNMMMTRFNPADYTFGTGPSWDMLSSQASVATREPGWGLSAQWSPDNTFWVELGWQRAPELIANIDTRRSSIVYIIPCRTNTSCPFDFGFEQTNRHRITADDFTLALKAELIPNNKYLSILWGVGVHRRFLRDNVDIVTSRYGRTVTNDSNAGDSNATREKSSEVHRTERVPKTRLFMQADVELYPAGKKRFIGLGISGRWLSAGNREHIFVTNTLVSNDVRIGIRPGWVDVTGRLIFRF